MIINYLHKNSKNILRYFFRLKFKIIFVFLVFFGSANAQNYRLEQAFADKAYFNAVYFNNEIVLGTSEGPFVFKNNEISPLNSKFKKAGFIKIVEDELSTGSFKQSSEFDFLLPKIYENTRYASFVHRDNVLLFVNGELYSYKILPYDFKSSPSVRSISESFIATYQGVYDRSMELQKNFPSYSNGKIIEFNDETWLCWDGLFITEGENSTNYFNSSTFELEINNTTFGHTRNAIKLGEDLFLVATTKGLVKFDRQKMMASFLYETANKVEPIIAHQTPNFIIFSADNKIFQLNLPDEEITFLYEHDDTIIDLYTYNNWLFYILDNSRLMIIDLEAKNIEIILDNLEQPLNVISFYNKLIVTSNVGLSIYDLSSGKKFYNLIKTEFNRYAYYKGDRFINLGAVSGFYRLSVDSINSMFYIEESKSEIKATKESIPFYIIVIIGLLIVIIILLVIINSIRAKNTKVILNEHFTLEENIKKYISQHLATVKLSTLTSVFNIDLNELYRVFKDTSPGEFIRSERVKLVYRMRKEKRTEEEIAKATGFSISYLKKI